MRLEPRIQRLETRAPDDTLPVVTSVELRGPGNEGTPAVSRFEDGRWSGFQMVSSR
jgi:hypothetical protein